MTDLWRDLLFGANATREDILVASGTFGAVLALGLLLRFVLLRALRVADGPAPVGREIAHRLLRRADVLGIGAVAVHLAVRHLELHPVTDRVLQLVVVGALTLRAIQAGLDLVGYLFETRFDADDLEGSAEEAIVGRLRFAASAVVVVVGAVFALDNLGVEIGSLLVGAGVGGAVLAIGSQSALKGVFGWLAILVERPVRPGDFVAAGRAIGLVEDIGLRTTRLRTTFGSVVFVPNTELLERDIVNFSRSDHFVIRFEGHLAYDVDPTALERLPDLAAAAVAAHPGVVLRRALLEGFDERGLRFAVVAKVAGVGLHEYRRLHHEIGIDLLARLGKEGLTFSAPIVAASAPSWLGGEPAIVDD